MTPPVRYYAEWRISVYRFNLSARLTSTNDATREHAALCEREANMLQACIITPPERYTAEMAAWADWIAAACQLYHEAHQDSDYWQRADLLREKRDAALAGRQAA